MDNKIVIGAITSALLALVAWNISTTHELTLSVQRLEIILLNDAMLK